MVRKIGFHSKKIKILVYISKFFTIENFISGKNNKDIYLLK